MKIASDSTVLVCHGFFDFYSALGSVSDFADSVREKLAKAMDSGVADDWQDQDDMFFWLDSQFGFTVEFELFPFHGYSAVEIKR